MQITNEFEVDQPIGTVWEFFGDIPAVAECLPGTDLTDDLGEDRYGGTVAIGLGPVKLDFDGEVKILERNDADKRIRVDASGADKKGRGQAAMLLDARLVSAGSGTRVNVAMDLNISGAAAQYGRGLVSDITSVLLDDFAANLQNRFTAVSQGRDPSQVQNVKPASGFAITLRAASMALIRVFRRFFLPYDPEFVRGG